MPAGIFLSKLISVFVLPLGLCVWLAVTALVVSRWRWKTGAALLCVSMGVLWLFSTPAFSSFLLASLERRYPPVSVEASPVADAIAILGGAVRASDAPGMEADLTDSTDRVFHAARLYRAGKAPMVIAVTGPIACEDPMKSEAGAVLWLLREWGVLERAVISETGSFNTATDAGKIKQAMASRGVKKVLLVTSASHMRRAMAVFRSAGIDAIPSPTDHEEMDCRRRPAAKRVLLKYLPDAEALAKSTKAVNEYVGMVWYRLRGWV